MIRARLISQAIRSAALAVSAALGGCVTTLPPMPWYEEPYALLTVDESMSCEAIKDSFRFSARRAARIEYWLGVGPIAGYGHARFEIDAPPELVAEYRRMDALSDLQRFKGCRVIEPRDAVVYERAKIAPGSPPLPVLQSKG